MTITFTNQGEIDIRGATIAGISAKENSRTAIGKFGTGLKYGIASVLRWGGAITIWSGTTSYEFAGAKLDFRGKEFQQVTMSIDGADPVPLGFTTHYGNEWEPWMVFREFYANARDESGDVERGEQHVGAGRTAIVITCAKLEDEFPNRDTIILPSHSNPKFTCPAGSIWDRPSELLYYRGVRVKKHHRTATFTYNLAGQLELTEDRTLAYSWHATTAVCQLLMLCTDKGIIRRALSAREAWEVGLDAFSSWNDYSPEFLEVAGELYRKDPVKHQRLRDFLGSKDPDSCRAKEVDISKTQRMMLTKATRLATSMFPGGFVAGTVIKICDLGHSTLGMYDKETDEVMLDPKLFDQGTKQVLSTLYEELVHRHTDKSDLTYDMQTHLFNTIISLYEEHVWGEPV